MSLESKVRFDLVNSNVLMVIQGGLWVLIDTIIMEGAAMYVAGKQGAVETISLCLV